MKIQSGIEFNSNKQFVFIGILHLINHWTGFYENFQFLETY